MGYLRKILVSVKFMSAFLGPEMAAPILWTHGKKAFFLQEKPVSIKFLVLGGGGIFGFGGGGSADFIFMGAGIFLSIAAIVSGYRSDSIAVSRDMGPLSLRAGAPATLGT